MKRIKCEDCLKLVPEQEIEELKEIYSIIDASQLKKEEKKKSHGQGEGSGR